MGQCLVSRYTADGAILRADEILIDVARWFRSGARPFGAATAIDGGTMAILPHDAKMNVASHHRRTGGTMLRSAVFEKTPIIRRISSLRAALDA